MLQFSSATPPHCEDIAIVTRLVSSLKDYVASTGRLGRGKSGGEKGGKRDQNSSGVGPHKVPQAIRRNDEVLIVGRQLAVRHGRVGDHKLLELLATAPPPISRTSVAGGGKCVARDSIRLVRNTTRY